MRFNSIRFENVMKKTNTTYKELNSHFNYDIESMVKKEDVIGSVIKHCCEYMRCNFDYVIGETDTLKIRNKVYTYNKERKHKSNYIDNVLIPEIVKIMIEDKKCTFKVLSSFMDKNTIFNGISNMSRLKCINPDNLNNLCWVLHCSISDITTISDNNDIVTSRILNNRQKYSIKFDVIEDKLEYLSKSAYIPMWVLNDLRDNNYVSIEFIRIVASSLKMDVNEISNYTEDKEEKCMSDYYENTDTQISNENESVVEPEVEIQTTASDISNDDDQLSDNNDYNRKPYYNNYRNTRRYGNRRRNNNKWKDIDNIPLNAIIGRLNICTNDELNDIAKYIESVKNIRQIKTTYSDPIE